LTKKGKKQARKDGEKESKIPQLTCEIKKKGGKVGGFVERV